MCIGDLSLGPDFDGLLLWGHIDNRPFLRCMHGCPPGFPLHRGEGRVLVLSSMDLFAIISVLITLAALFSYVNHHTMRMPMTIGVMGIALLLSIALLLLQTAGVHLERPALGIVNRIDFNQTVLHGLLAFLLFAGALHVNMNDLREQKWTIGILATVGVILSTVIVGSLMWVVFRLFHLPVRWVDAFLFGALISPTDPIAVMGILKSAGAPRSLEIKITGESLFNDGIGVVIFLILLEIASGAGEVTSGTVASLFVHEAIGGALFGGIAGLVAYYMLKSTDDYQVEVLITLSLVMGTYALADSLHLSGPIAMVVSGILIGNHGRAFAMSDRTREHLDMFWKLVDDILNAVLFVLIGVEVLVVSFSSRFLAAGLVAVPIVLFARMASVAIPVGILRRFRSFSPRVIRILTWAGLRGGISVALALSLPDGPAREPIVAVTYCVVVFSIMVQGLTVRKLFPHP